MLGGREREREREGGREKTREMKRDLLKAAIFFKNLFRLVQSIRCPLAIVSFVENTVCGHAVAYPIANKIPWELLPQGDHKMFPNCQSDAAVGGCSCSCRAVSVCVYMGWQCDVVKTKDSLLDLLAQTGLRKCTWHRMCSQTLGLTLSGTHVSMELITWNSDL